MCLFHKPADYDAFVDLLADAAERVPGVRLLAYCLMPNHWHLVLHPAADGELSSYMRWLSNTHVRRWRQHWHSVGQGHVYQGRYKSFPVQEDAYLLMLLRYVESNALRAGLVRRAERWRWSSLASPASPDGRALLSASPMSRPRGWLAIVNQPMEKPALSALRDSVGRGRPYGDPAWVSRIARRLGLEFTLRPRGRPRKVRSAESKFER
jgi:putative transposase